MYRVAANSEYADPQFDKALSARHDLSIQVSLDGFSFCVVDPASYHVRHVKSYAFAPDLALDDYAGLVADINYWDDLLRLPYRRVRLMYASERSTVVPDALYDPARHQEVIESLFEPVVYAEEYFANRLGSVDAWSVSTVPEPVSRALLAHQPDALWYNPAVPVCERMLTEKFTGGQSRLIVNRGRGWADLFVTENGALTLHNRCQCTHHLDVAYYVVNVVDQLSLDPDRVALRLMGEVDRDSAEVAFLRKYLPNVSLERVAPFFQGAALERLPAHRFVNLLNLSLCE